MKQKQANRGLPHVPHDLPLKTSTALLRQSEAAAKSFAPAAEAFSAKRNTDRL
jgi:hypothetical protein